MAPSACIDLEPTQQSLLLHIARRSIEHGLEQGTLYRVALEDERRVDIPVYGVFTTLELEGKLRGCMGEMDCALPAAQAVSEVSYTAAFRDPRFGPLQPSELDRVDIEISLLSTPEPLAFESREQLLAQLAPGEDGLLLQDGRHRATFLPKVWEKLPEPAQFLDQLLAKAGLPLAHWSSSLRASRYRAHSFSERATATASR